MTAQPFLDQAKLVVDTLSSPYFEGRGYINNGDSLAAAYIANQFRLIGVPPLLDSYEQEFSLTVSLHHEAPVLRVNNTPLKLGYDYLPYASSPSDTLMQHAHIRRVGSGVYYPSLEINEYNDGPVTDAVVIINDQVPDSLRANSNIPPEYLTRAFRAEVAAYLEASAALFLTSSPLAYGGDFREIQIPAFVIREDAWPSEVNSIDLAINSHLDAPVTTSNIIALQKGTHYPEKYIMVIGHYDHLGSLGPDVYFPGANDNASGIALILNLASYFQKKPPPYSIVYIAFSGEEQGLTGSRYFIENTPLPLSDIRFLINLDMVASGREGIIAQGGVEYKEEYELLSTLNDSLRIGKLGRRRNSPNSDHFLFLAKGVRGFFIYTNKGTQPYHHIDDIPATLNWDEYSDTFLLVRHFIEAID